MWEHTEKSQLLGRKEPGLPTEKLLGSGMIFRTSTNTGNVLMHMLHGGCSVLSGAG